MQKASDGAAVHALVGSTEREGSGVTENGIHELESVGVFVGPWEGLEGDVGLGRFGPGTVFANYVLRLFAFGKVLGNSEHFSKTFLGELIVFLVVLDIRGNDEALLSHGLVGVLEGLQVGEVSNYCSEPVREGSLPAAHRLSGG